MTDEGATLRKRAARARLRTYAPEPRQDHGWRDEAACRELDPDLFFPTDKAGEKEAVAHCAGCPVQGACLDFAVTTRQYDGVWGGLGEDDRQRMRPRRRRK